MRKFMIACTVFVATLPHITYAVTCSPTPISCPRGYQQIYVPPKSTECRAGGYECTLKIENGKLKSNTAPPSSVLANRQLAARQSGTLAYGAKGSAVTTLQQQLVALKLLPADSASGYFGAGTRAAVRSFQCKQLLLCSGRETINGYGAVGNKTKVALAVAVAAAFPHLTAKPIEVPAVKVLSNPISQPNSAPSSAPFSASPIAPSSAQGSGAAAQSSVGTQQSSVGARQSTGETQQSFYEDAGEYAQPSYYTQASYITSTTSK